MFIFGFPLLMKKENLIKISDILKRKSSTKEKKAIFAASLHKIFNRFKKEESVAKKKTPKKRGKK
jgi:hypothetical protein